MKVKKILVTYLKSGTLEGEVARAMMFEKVVTDLEAEGKVIKDVISNEFQQTVIFEDGSQVDSLPFGIGLRVGRITHAYVDASFTTIPNGIESVQKVVFPMLMIGEYSKFDTSGIQFSLYKHKDGKLEIT